MTVHPIEQFTTDSRNNISYRRAKQWLGAAMCWFGLWSALGIIGLIILVSMFVEKFSLAGFLTGAAFVVIGGGFALRKGAQITTCFDPFTKDKVLDSRSVAEWSLPGVDERETAPVVERRRPVRSGQLVDDDDLASAVG